MKGFIVALSFTVRIVWLDLETRVGTIVPACNVEYEVSESIETDYKTPEAAAARASTITREGFAFDAGGRIQYVPASRIERVEVYTVPESK